MSQRVGHPRLPIFSLRTHSRPKMRIYGIISFCRAGQLAFAFPRCGRNAVFGFLLPVVFEGLSLVRQNRTCFFLIPFLFLSDAVDLPRLLLVYIVVETHRRLGVGAKGLVRSPRRLALHARFPFQRWNPGCPILKDPLRRGRDRILLSRLLIRDRIFTQQGPT